MENLERKNHQNKPYIAIPAVVIMVCVYIFLFIERPWESIRYLDGIPIERPFAIAMIIVAFAAGKFKIVSSPTNKWVYGMLLLHFILAPFAYNSGYAVDQGIEYAKVVVLYLLILAVGEDEDCLKLLIKVFVFSMLFYMLHSLWEYHNGRYEWRMGISRMIGVDKTFESPNSFGASVVLSLPFVYALLRTEVVSRMRKLYYGYYALAVLCVVLTGSRSAFIALIVLLLAWALFQQGKRKIVILIVTLLAIGAIWISMPEEKRERIRTLWDENAGPANAHESARGRLIGWYVSWEIFKQQPFTGVGGGGQNFIGYRMAHDIDDIVGSGRSPTQSHVLYGQVLAEFGVAGMICFAGLVISTLGCCVKARQKLSACGLTDSFIYILCGAIVASLLLLLLFGLGGHNFYRPLWLWQAAWSGSLLMIAGRGSPERSADF